MAACCQKNEESLLSRAQAVQDELNITSEAALSTSIRESSANLQRVSGSALERASADGGMLSCTGSVRWDQTQQVSDRWAGRTCEEPCRCADRPLTPMRVNSSSFRCQREQQTTASLKQHCWCSHSLQQTHAAYWQKSKNKTKQKHWCLKVIRNRLLLIVY